MAADRDGRPSTPRGAHLRASPPLLPWPLLDRLTRVHPAVPVVLYVPVIVLLLVRAGRGTAVADLAACTAVGYAAWTLTEYWLHRVVFHWEPEQGLGARLHFLIHGVHHEHPNDPGRLVMPPAASLPLAAAFTAAFVVLAGRSAGMALAAGFLAGYVGYDTTHFWLHHRTPRSRVGRHLRERHMRHHFEDDTRAYGVSAPYWDVVFGTAARTSRRPADRRATPAIYGQPEETFTTHQSSSSPRRGRTE